MGILVGLNTSATNNLIMKFLVLFAVVASAAAQTLITHPNGAVTPDLTPEQKAATAAHLATKGFAHPYAYGYPYAGAYNGYFNGAYPFYNGAFAGAYPFYNHGALVTYANGAVAPAKTAEVVAAEHAHFAAHGIAAPVAPIVYAAGYPYAVAGLTAHPNGAVVPVEPQDVLDARAEHLSHF